MNKTNAKVQEMKEEGYDNQQIIDALQDGEALCLMGLSDEDQSDIEEAVEELKK